MRNKNWLDFIIIGAQKSGTTTLFRHLVEHPAIHMPAEKEVPFFNVDERYTKGLDWFLCTFFSEAPENKLWGKATPQYMCYPEVPGRIAKQLPKVKLIAILRDPIARAYSHYRMSVRRGLEKRSFDVAIQMQLELTALEQSRQNPTRTNSYIVWGEYGRILTAFTEYFQRDQLLILFTSDLEHNPENVMVTIYKFLDVEAYQPRTLGEKFNKGGKRLRIPQARILTQLAPVVKEFLPIQLSRRLAYWFFKFERWNTIPDESGQLEVSSGTSKALHAHFGEDGRILQHTLQCNVPWLPYHIALDQFDKEERI